MAGKLLRNISPDKIKNRDAEYYKQALDLTGCPTITGSNNFITSFPILRLNQTPFFQDFELPDSLLSPGYR